MDKLMENHWFLKGISLLLACMLFMSATLTEKNTTSGILPFANDAKETLTNYAINVKYDEEKYIVSGIPAEGVKVKLEGPKAAVATAKAKKQFDIPVDLRDSEKGTYEVSLKTNGLPDDVKGTVQPSTIKITLHEKARKYVHVDLKLSNEDQMAAGATLEKSNIKPDAVEVVGTKEEIESISSAKAYIDLKGVNKTVTKTAEVTLYNKEGKRLNVRTSPSKISVTLNVATQATANNTEKTVPIAYTKKGSLPEGLAVTNISVEPREVTIAGPKDILDNIQSIEGVEVDLSQLTESTTFDTSVLLPKGVTSAKPNQVKVSVGVQKTKQTKTRTIDGISIQKNGLSKDVTAQLLSPQDGKISTIKSSLFISSILLSTSLLSSLIRCFTQRTLLPTTLSSLTGTIIKLSRFCFFTISVLTLLSFRAISSCPIATCWSKFIISSISSISLTFWFFRTWTWIRTRPFPFPLPWPCFISISLIGSRLSSISFSRSFSSLSITHL
ncbi:YbbR [Bacillus cereus]|nr:YbbR [Bacillus cereus]